MTDTSHPDLWGTCVGSELLCTDGVVRTDPRYTQGYACTGGRHIGPGEYIRCTWTGHRAPTTSEWFAVRQRDDVDVLLRLAVELETLAAQVDAGGRSEGAGLRADAAHLRRIAEGMNAAVVLTTIAIPTAFKAG